jgi:hypothetical protein
MHVFLVNFNISADNFVTLQTETIKSASTEITDLHIGI